MRGIYLKSLSYPYSFGSFIFLELPKSIVPKAYQKIMTFS